MLTKKEVYTHLRNILNSIFENKDKNVSAASEHLTSIKNVNSQNFETYIFNKCIEYGTNLVQEVPSESVLNMIKKDYNQDKINQKIYFDSSKYKLNENIIYIVKNICGTQSPPDFTLLIHGYIPILLEAKSSKGKRPLWNCSLPNKNTIYLFYSGGYNRIFIHLSRHILDDETEVILRDLYDQIKMLVNKVHEEKIKKLDTKKKWDYYPRPMYNQKFDYDLSQINNFFQEVLDELQNNYIILSPDYVEEEDDIASVSSRNSDEDDSDEDDSNDEDDLNDLDVLDIVQDMSKIQL